MQSRRRMLAATGSLLTGGAVGAVATSRIVEPARAAEADLSVAGDEVTVRNGSVAGVWLDLAVEWAYAVPSGEQPATAVVDVLAGTGDELPVVETIENDATFLEESGEGTISVNLLEAGGLDGATLVPETAGETRETTVDLAVEFRVIDEGGLVIAADSQTDTATVAVTLSEYDPGEHGTVAGSGELTVTVE